MKTLGLLFFCLSLHSFAADEERILTINSVGHKGAIRDLIVDSKKNIITGGYDKVVKIWNSEEGYLEREIYGQIGPGSEGQIFNMALSTDEKYLATGGWFGSSTGTEPVGDIRIYNYKTGELIRLLSAHGSPINQLEFMSYKHLVSMDGSGYVLLWDVTTGEYVQFKNVEQDVSCIGILDNYLVTGHRSGTVNLWSTSSMDKPVRTYTGLAKENRTIHTMAVAPSNEYIAIASGTDVIILNDKLKNVYEWRNGDDDITRLAFSPNSNKLLVAASSYYIRKNKMKAYYEVEGKWYAMSSYINHIDLVMGAAFVDNKTCVTAGGRDNEIAIWRPSESKKFSKEIMVIKGAASPFYAVAINGSKIAYTTAWSKNFGFSKLTHVFDLESRRIVPIPDEDSALFNQPEIEQGEYTLDSKLIDHTRESLNLKKGKATVAKVSRNNENGSLHNCYSFVKNDYFVSGGGYGFLQAYNFKGELVTNYVGHEGDIWGLSISEDNKYIISCSNDQTIKLWRTDDIGKENVYPVASIFVTNDFEWVIWNPAGYFTSSKKGASYVGYHVNQGKNVEAKFYPFEQFDLKYNRPDIIMSELGVVDQSIIDLYYMAYLKRLKRMGISEEDLSVDLNVPVVEVKSKKKTGNNLEISFEASDEKVNLNRLNVFINDVPVFGRKGIDLTADSTKSIKRTVTVELMSGRNKIQLSVLNNNGAESLKETFYAGGEEGNKPNLYILSIGVSAYLDSAFNLDYAAKDAQDINALFTGSDLYGDIKSKVLVNENVTKKEILDAKNFFKEAKANDVVIIFIAGHGVLDSEMDYYFCTYDIDFQDPAKKGISYERLESLFDGIVALKKLLIMDTCHSGEVDKEDIEEIAEVNSELGDITFRTTNATTTYTERSGLKQTNEAVKEMFNDLRRGTGATVLSSAGGVEFAMESEDWKNGLFTYCLLKGLTSGDADQDGDGEIFLSELQTYVREQVVILSKGKQQPTSRLENISLDYRIW